MKIVFTSMLLMIMAIAQAMPNGNDSLDNGKKAKSTTPSNPTTAVVTMSMQQLQEENAVLKMRLAEMENKLEDEKSMLQYKYAMLKLVTAFEGNGNMEKMEDLKSQVNFNKMMSTALFMINKESGK
jgi:hypothetical protein